MNCPTCKLHGDAHGSPQECIEALQHALIRQRRAAETLAFDISTRFLAVLESLAVDPDEGLGYHVQGKPLAPVQVSGVFAAIWRRYSAQGDWSPLRELEAKNVALEEQLRAAGISTTPRQPCSQEPASSPRPSTPGEPSDPPR